MSLFAALLRDQVRASVIEGALVMHLPRADTPSVLRIDLRAAGAAIFAVQPAAGHHDFGFYTPRESASQTPAGFTALARFATRQDAENALAAATKALLWNPKGLRRTVARAMLWGIVFAVLLFVALFSMALIEQKIRSAMTGAQQQISAAVQTPHATAGEMPEGTPQPADQYLTVPQQ